MKTLPFLLALLFAAFSEAADVPVKFLPIKDMKRDDPRFDAVLNNIRADEQKKHSGAERTFTIVQNFGKNTYLVLMDDGKAAVVDNLGGAHADQDQVRAAIINSGKLYEYASTSGANRTLHLYSAISGKLDNESLLARIEKGERFRMNMGLVETKCEQCGGRGYAPNRKPCASCGGDGAVSAFQPWEIVWEIPKSETPVP